MEENKNEIIAADGEVTVVGVTFREAGKVYYFSPEKFKLAVGDRVIVNTSRGLEIGTVRMANKSVPVSDTVSPLKPVLRKASAEDIERAAKNRAAEVEAAGVWKEGHHYDRDKGSDVEVRLATSPFAPCLVAPCSHERLNDHSHKRRKHPEETQGMRVSTQCREDAADVGTLKRICDLDSEESKTQIHHLA